MTDRDIINEFMTKYAQSLAEERSSELRYVLMQHIVRACQAKGWTLTQLADELKVHRSQVSRFLSGIANPTLETIAKYEAALGTPILEINRVKSIAFESRSLPAVPPAAQGGPVISEDDLIASDSAELYRHTDWGTSARTETNVESAGPTSFAMAA